MQCLICEIPLPIAHCWFCTWRLVLLTLSPCNRISFAWTVFAAWSPSPSPSPSSSPLPWQPFSPMKPWFSFSFLHSHHRHHPGHHNSFIRYMKPYYNLLLYSWLSSSSKLCKSTVNDFQEGSINSPCQVCQDSPRVLEYVHYWHPIWCSTPPPVLTPFERLQINSNQLTGRLSRFGSSSTLRPCKDTGVHPLLTLNSLLYSSSCYSSSYSCMAQPLRSCPDQHWLSHW